jgi:hypothetical protein
VHRGSLPINREEVQPLEVAVSWSVIANRTVAELRRSWLTQPPLPAAPLLQGATPPRAYNVPRCLALLVEVAQVALLAVDPASGGGGH